MCRKLRFNRRASIIALKEERKETQIPFPGLFFFPSSSSSSSFVQVLVGNTASGFSEV